MTRGADLLSSPAVTEAGELALGAQGPATASAPTGERTAAAGWASLAALAAGHFAVDCSTGIWPVYKTLAHLDLATAGLIATAGAMTGNALQIGFGLLADRGWRRRLLMAGPVLAGAVTLAPWTGSYPVLFLLVLATYVGSAAFHPAGTGAAATLSKERTGLMVALFMAGGYLGYSLSQVLFSLIHAAAPRLTPVLLAIPIAAALATARLVPRAPPPPRVPGATWRLLRPQARPLATLFALQVLTTGLNLAFIFLLPDLLVARGAPGWMVAGGGHFALVAGACLSLLPAGHAADRWGPRPLLLVANLGAGAVLAALLGRPGATPLDLVLVAAFGAFNGVNNVVAVAEGNRLMPGQASAASALLMGTPWCLAATALVLAGLLADPARGGSPAAALSWMALAVPAALALALLVRAGRGAGGRLHGG